ncbi:MAG: glycosyltransferase [Pseudomonadota bacterium]|nr:glycosyltransferase [Pseudomonadota bacterium]
MTQVLQVVGSPSLGGAELFFSKLVNGLHEQGTEVAVLARARSGIAERIHPGVRCLHLPMRNMVDYYSRWRISSIVADLKPSAVQTYMGRATWLTRLSDRKGPVHLARLGGFYGPKRYRHAHYWVGNTPAICDHLRRHGFPSHRIRHIPNFVEPAKTATPDETLRLRRQIGIPEDALVVMAAGRMVEKKGFQDLLFAFAGLPRSVRGRPLFLLILGGGEDFLKLRALACQLGVQQRTRWPGWQADLGPYYSMADVFVCPSRHEPFGNVILEAWSYGVPVVCTHTHAARELIEHGQNGLVVPVQRLKAIAGSLLSLLEEDASAPSQLVEGGQTTLKARFGKSEVIESYRFLYHELATRGVPAIARRRGVVFPPSAMLSSCVVQSDASVERCTHDARP